MALVQRHQVPLYLAQRQMAQLLGSAAPQTFDPVKTIERAVQLRDGIQKRGLDTTRFDTAISFYHDLHGDELLDLQTAKDIWANTESQPDRRLIQGFDHFVMIGEGTHSIVYRATKNSDKDQEVAIKVGRLREGDYQAKARFQREHDLMKRCQSDRVVKVESLGETERGKPYLVLEHLPHGTLKQFIGDVMNGTKYLTWEHFYRLASQILEAGCVAHEAGLYHNDYSPENCMLDKDENLKLGDFSVAIDKKDARKLVGRRIGRLDTIPGETTPSSYTEVFRMGCLMYYMLTGEMPFDQSCGLLQTIIYSPLPPSKKAKKGNTIPPEIDSFVMRAIRNHAKHRFQDPLHMRKEFKRLGGLLAKLTTPI